MSREQDPPSGSNSVTEEELAELVRRSEEAASAYIRGDMDRYLALTEHAIDYTLVQPLGGPPNRYQERAAGLSAAGSPFTAGEAHLEHVATHAWGDTVVLVMVERQHGVVSGLPDHDWSLRVTLVYRRDGSHWLLVHRHADPLVRPISLEQLGALIRAAH